MNAARDETRVRGLKRNKTEVSRERALRRFQSSNAPKLLLYMKCFCHRFPRAETR